MKRRVVKFFALILLALFVPLLFVGCNEEKETLSSPTLKLEQTQNGLYAVASEVENAIGYYFSVNNVYFYSKSEQLNLDNIALENKLYKIKVYAVGGKKYNNSEYSNECMYFNQDKYETPVLNIINNSVLSWTNIGNVTYQIKINNSLQFVETTDNQISLFDESIYSKLNLTSDNTFSVRVKKKNQTLQSEYSNEVTFAFISMLETPTNILIQKGENKTTLYWRGNADTYNVYLNNNFIAQTQNNSLDISSYILDAGEYSFSVKAISNSVLIASSNESETATIITEEKLATPVLQAEFDGENINIKWNHDNLVKSYNLTINDNTTEVFANSFILNKDYLLNSEIEEYKFSIVANGYKFYNSSDSSEEVVIKNLFSKLSAPSQLQVVSLNDAPYLSFVPELDAQHYMLKISYTKQVENEPTQENEELEQENEEPQLEPENNDITEEYEINSSFVSLLNYISEPNTYKICVKTIGKDFLLDSEYSSEISYDYTLKLNTVNEEDIEYEIIDTKLKINWKGVEKATSYNLKISYDKYIYLKTDLKETTYIYNLTKSGKYSISIQAETTDKNYTISDYSKEVVANYSIVLQSPSNCECKKEDSYLVITWLPVKYAKTYRIENENLAFTDETTETEYKILLSKFNPYEKYVFELTSLSMQGGEVITSPRVSVEYTHEESAENKGETYLIDNTEKDFYIENYKELVSIVKYAYEYKKSAVNVYLNFNYAKDLEENFYSDYTLIYEDYSKEDSSIKNEIISAIIENDLAGKIEFDFTKINLTKYKIIFEFEDFEVNKYYSSESNYQINTKFVGYSSGTCETIACEELDETPLANSINSTEVLLKVLKLGYKPVFEQSINGNVVIEYYNSAVEILKSIISLDASKYEMALSVYDYLCNNITYDFALQTELNRIENLTYNQYYSSNIDGVFKNKKATSVGFAKTYAMMLNMLGINAEGVITTYEGNKIGYVIVSIDEKYYVVDFYSSIFVSNEIDNKDMQYYSHYYFFDNTSLLEYINSSVEVETISFFETYKQNTNTVNLVLTPSTAKDIIEYCSENNISAIELQCNINIDTLNIMFEMVNYSELKNNQKFYSNLGTLFIQVS